jgi:hypothetical protein
MKVRQLRAMEKTKLLQQIATIKAEIKTLEKDQKKPEGRIIADLNNMKLL